MHRSITLVSDLDPDSLPASIELYRFSMRGDQSARPILIRIERILEWNEVILRRYGKVASIESFAKVTFVATDWLVDSNQVRARLESPFDLQLLERCEDAWVDVTAAEDLLAELHQVCD